MIAWILPLGLCAAVVAALWAPTYGLSLHEGGILPLLVALIFFVSGLQTQLHQLRLEPRFARTFVTAAIISLALAPLLGYTLLSQTWLNGLDPQLALGLQVMTLVPPTLSSCVVLTQVAGGKVIWSLLMTLGLNLLGILSIPLWVPILIGDLSVGLSAGLSSWPLLVKLVQIVLLPFAAGLLLRRSLGTGSWSRRCQAAWIKQLPTLCVILSVWVSLSASEESLTRISLPVLILVGGLALLLHLGLLLLCSIVGRRQALLDAERYALMLTASQKTLPVAVSVLVGLGSSAGVAVISCILFHFLQLIVDSLLASRLRARS